MSNYAIRAEALRHALDFKRYTGSGADTGESLIELADKIYDWLSEEFENDTEAPRKGRSKSPEKIVWDNASDWMGRT